MPQAFFVAGPDKPALRRRIPVVHSRLGSPAVALVLAVTCATAVAAIAGCRSTSGETDKVSPLAGEGEVAESSEFDVGSSPIRLGTYLAAGRLAESRNDLPMAATQYRLALKKDPKDREALYRLGVVLSKVRDTAAVDVWKRYLAVTDGAAVGWANLGFCYELLDEPALAEAAYQKGLARDAKSEECRVNYGIFLAGRGDYDAAAAQLAEALTPAQSWYNIGSVCEKQGKTDAAATAYRRALELDPEFIVAQRRLTMISSPTSAPAPEQRVSSTVDEPGR